MTKQGGWPKSIEHHMRKISLEAGYNRSRLPEFTHAEVEYMKGIYINKLQWQCITHCHCNTVELHLIASAMVLGFLALVDNVLR